MFGREIYNPYITPTFGINPTFNIPANQTLANGLLRGNVGRGATGLLSRLRSNINWSGIITNTGKTLDVINRAIPIVKQAGPMFNNMKTMFKLASAFKDESGTNQKEVKDSSKKEVSKEEEKNYNEEPVFFI